MIFWMLYKSVSDHLKIPYYNSIGNHDVLGWSSRRKISADDADLGKEPLMNKLGMQNSYYSFNYKGWHFCGDGFGSIGGSRACTSYKGALVISNWSGSVFDLCANANMPTVVMTYCGVCSAK